MSAGTVELLGEVSTGCGEGTRFTQLPWARREFSAKLGFEPSPGTFNLSLQGAAWERLRARLATATGVIISPPEGFCRAKCFAVQLADEIAGAAVFPDVEDYPGDKMEILARVAVRPMLGLQDGERVKVKLWLDWAQGEQSLRQATARDRIAGHGS